MRNAVQLLSNPNDLKLKIKCVTTGEVATVGEWAEQIAKRLNMPKESVRTGLYRMMRSAPTGTAYGLAWERVGSSLNDGGAVVLSTPESKVKAKAKK